MGWFVFCTKIKCFFIAKKIFFYMMDSILNTHADKAIELSSFISIPYTHHADLGRGVGLSLNCRAHLYKCPAWVNHLQVKAAL